ncbi:hypothetical protein ACS0TY_029786 [Phlomoides rotata]
MVCDRSGTSKAQKCSKKIYCKARLNAKKLDDGTCMVTTMVKANDIADLRSCKNVRLCEVQCGGPQNLGCLTKDYRNYIEERRRVRLDSEGRLCNVLWINPRSRDAYEEFHDIVSFDTTYIVNRYKMPFASIVGVNHPGHSILVVFTQMPSLQTNVKWAGFLVKFHLENNVWLRELYDARQKWLLVYLHHTFWVGMMSTQRSEGMHAYFDEFVHSRSTFKQFMEQYVMTIGNKIQKECLVDFHCKNKVIKCKMTFPWEMQFQKAYTNSIFKLVQDETGRMMYCHCYMPNGR